MKKINKRKNEWMTNKFTQKHEITQIKQVQLKNNSEY